MPLAWRSTSTRCHLTFSAVQALFQAGFGGGSFALLITVELGSAALWNREAVPKGRSLHKFGGCLGKQKIQQAYIPKEVGMLRNTEPNVYQWNSYQDYYKEKISIWKAEGLSKWGEWESLHHDRSNMERKLGALKKKNSEELLVKDVLIDSKFCKPTERWKPLGNWQGCLVAKDLLETRS